MGAAHWIYLSGIILIIAVMIARKNVVIPAVAATFLTAWVFTGDFATGLESIFNASLTAASELFGIFLIIALVTALLGFGVLIIGMITGLDGSGFSGLPLTGSLAGTLGPASGVDPALLAAIGQMGSIWSGGGVLVAWSSLIAVAGFTRVPVLELVRRSFLPVIAGLAVSTMIGLIIY
ncbi:hypothetical protein [Actinomadura sp. 3N407]|uniref:hypothetical protein n=1 Tax=Actinomadura sp. 3N407 TaxID=3457423 RepID=UPI003FCC8FF9